jgi:hypothetical protein
VSLPTHSLTSPITPMSPPTSSLLLAPSPHHQALH